MNLLTVRAESNHLAKWTGAIEDPDEGAFWIEAGCLMIAGSALFAEGLETLAQRHIPYGQRLVQFQCMDHGTLFYYQHTVIGACAVVQSCPCCGSANVKATARTWPPLLEEGA
jgi:hypothetical protein